MYSDAVISSDEMYRYQLTRVWDNSKPILGFVMLNPSKAGKTANDPTVLECMSMARRWDYGGIIICNEFAYRATNPRDMMSAEDPVGPENDNAIKMLSRLCNVIVLAWGTNGGYLNRDKHTISLLKTSNPNPILMCLGKTKSGQPMHPLGTIGPIKLIPFEMNT